MNELDKKVEELLSVQSGPFKGKPQQWFTRKDVYKILRDVLSQPEQPVSQPAIAKELSNGTN